MTRRRRSSPRVSSRPDHAAFDAGCGPGSWPYARRPDLRVTGCDVKFPPGLPPKIVPNHLFYAAPGRLLLGRSNYLGVAGECRHFQPYTPYTGLLHYNSKTTIGRVP